MQQRFLSIWPYFVFVVGMLAGLQFWPASYWLEVPSVQVNDGREPKNLDMFMNRKIHRTFNGTTAVALSKWEGEWVVICSGPSGTPGEFRAKAKLPERLTLGGHVVGRRYGGRLARQLLCADVPFHYDGAYPIRQ